jgi:hypothetical protein
MTMKQRHKAHAVTRLRHEGSGSEALALDPHGCAPPATAGGPDLEPKPTKVKQVLDTVSTTRGSGWVRSRAMTK